MYECPRCKKIFKTKRGHDLHIVKKTPCSFKEHAVNVCKFCKTNFNSYSKLISHLTSPNLCISIPNISIPIITENNYTQEHNYTQLNTAINNMGSQNQNIVINYIDNSSKNSKSNGLGITSKPEHNEFLQNVNPPNFNDYPVENLDYDTVKDVIKYKDEKLSDMIKEEYIDNVPPEMRAVWCLDSARNKFLLRIEDCWKLDIGGYKCYDKTMGKIENKIVEICQQKIMTNNHKMIELEDDEYFNSDIDTQHIYHQLKAENKMITNFLKAMGKSKHIFTRALKKVQTHLVTKYIPKSPEQDEIEFHPTNLLTNV